MAYFHSPRIITDGIVFYIDAANPKSYTGTGTVWKDISGNNHNVDLGSTVTHVSYNNTKVFNFAEDANGYGRNQTLNLSTSDNTVITFSRKNVAGNDGRVVTAYSNNWLLGHHDTSYGDYHPGGWVYNSVLTVDTQWRMFTGTGAITTDVWNLYINDNFIVGNNYGTAGPNGWNLNNYGGQYSDCQIALIIAYNRVLSAAEVKHNFNCFRGRFGI